MGIRVRTVELKPIPQCLREILEANQIKKHTEILFDTSKKYNGAGYSAYGQAALVAEYERVASAPDGNRNNTLNAAAFTIGQLVSGGEINHDYAFSQLIEAAGKCGLSNEEAERTANSGMIAGMEHPRSSKQLDDAQAGVEETLSIEACPDPSLIKHVTKRIEIPDGTAEDLQIWIIDNAARLSELNTSDLARIKIELAKKGAPKNFLNKDLPRLVKDAKPKDAANADPEQESMWEKCIEDLANLGYSFRMNELDDCVEVNGKRISDGIDAQIIMEMFDKGWNQGEGGAAYVRLAWTAQAYQNRYHPVREFLNSLEWDGLDWITELGNYITDKHPRIEYESGQSASVFCAFLKRWGIGAVGKALAENETRVQNPMLVFDGAQGAGKSTLVRFLCPMSDTYFIESHIEPDTVDHLRYLATRLVWEVGELGATTRKADRESLKAFLTKQDVTFRVPYGKHPITKPALTSFIGTVNPEVGFLNDPTGNRRFLPVEIDTIDFAYKKAIDPVQLWAQFVALYRSGESASLSPEEKQMVDPIRAQHEAEDHFIGFIAELYTIDQSKAIVSPANIDWSSTTSRIVEQLAMNGVTGVNVTNVGLSLVRLGLIKKRQQVNGVQEVRWYGLQRNNIGFRTRPSGF